MILVNRPAVVTSLAHPDFLVEIDAVARTRLAGPLQSPA
jgi:hypothetical protein